MAGAQLPSAPLCPAPWLLASLSPLQPAACPALCTVGIAGPRHAGEAGVLPTARLWRTGNGLPIPVCRYPWVGNHDGLQMEASVSQIAAERGGRATAQGQQQHPSVCSLLSQAAVHRHARKPNSCTGPQGQWAQPGLPISRQPLGTRRQERQLPSGWGEMATLAWELSISTAGSRCCCFHF